MATSNPDDLIRVASPLDLSLKVVNIVKTFNEDIECSNIKSPEDHRTVSSEELLSLKLLHDRLSRTMELLLPQEKLKKCDDPKRPHPQSSTPEFDYRAAMRALLTFEESENITSNEDDTRKSSAFMSNKVSTPSTESWSYWHDYILSLYVMNSSATPFLTPPPPIPPPPIPMMPTTTAMFPPLHFPAPSSNSLLFQNMLNNILSRPSTKCQESLSQDFVYKNKKLNSYRFLKDSNSLYNSFAASRNIGLVKPKLLDSPESFGVSLRGNQKYSIYYQQRPNNIFNNTFISPTNSSATCAKSSNNNLYRYSTNNSQSQLVDEQNKKAQIGADVGHRKTVLTNNKTQKTADRNESLRIDPKMFAEKGNKFPSLEHGNCKNRFNHSTRMNGVDSLHLGNRHRETAFSCSCGEEFENLYAFTIHMKLTQHIPPNSSKIERSIPKLVRGQDMWINSETEQTKEILRCMRCQQSFRTLPELTMHMVETNHYSEIVYSDTGKCVFLNSDHDKIKPSYTTISSPISSPENIIRRLKRTLSSSTCSDVGVEEECHKKMKISSPMPSQDDFNEQEERIDGIKAINGDGILQIKEADSGSVEIQPDSDSQSNSKTPVVIERQEASINSSNSYDSVIRQIENFVEKSLPKTLHNENGATPSVFCNTNSNHRTMKSSNKNAPQKPIIVDRVWKMDSKVLVSKNTDSFVKHKEKTFDTDNSLNFRNYTASASDNLENPLSSLQTLVETIQKNTSQIKDQGVNNYKVCSSQNKDSNLYSYTSKSPVVCDSLSQLQALVAGTSANHSTNNGTMTSPKHYFGYSSNERKKTIKPNETTDSSTTFISWCHKLGELLGLPQALSQAMLTQEAIKELTNSVLSMNNNQRTSMDVCSATEEENNNNEHTDSETKPFQSLESDPIEQLKHLLNSTSDSGQMLANKFPNGALSHSPPTISKKAKCNFCGKPFANKGQVRLHISKGKCPSLMRSCHSTSNQVDSLGNRQSPCADSSFPTLYKFKESQNNDTADIGEVDAKPYDSSMISNKSVNLIREYLKFAKQMTGTEAARASPSSNIENKVE